jgi:hypothetical protein
MGSKVGIAFLSEELFIKETIAFNYVFVGRDEQILNISPQVVGDRPVLSGTSARNIVRRQIRALGEHNSEGIVKT